MNEHCKYCTKPRRPRHDRPGKFFTLCDEHYAEYQREKNRESYKRHKNERVEASQKYREENPEKALACALKSQSKPEARRRRKEYMVLYNAPYRIHLKDRCEDCGLIPKSLSQLDIHHIDENKNNDDPSNLKTLCATCHRGIPRGSGQILAFE